MKVQKILYGQEAREKLALGADKLAKAVVSTLGPRSKNVALNLSFMPGPRVVHDGVTIARLIELEDPFENTGARLLKEAASKTNDLAGDGTTTATLLANTLIQEGMKLLSGKTEEGTFSTKVNAMELRETLLLQAEKIVEELEKMAVKIKTDDQKRQIATISAQNEGIGNMVAEAIIKLGNDGVIMVESGDSFGDEIEYQEGMEFDNGYLSQGFITNFRRMMCEYEDGYILLTDQTIIDPQQIASIVDEVHQKSNKPLLIIANDIVGAALQTMVLTKLKNDYRLVGVIAPEYADRRKEMLEDLAVLTGGEVISETVGLKLNEVTISQLGRFRKIEVDQHKTRITPKNADPEEIKARVDSIKAAIDNAPTDFVKERHQERLAKLNQKVAMIKVGGASETEIDERKERFKDSISATKAAIAEGIVPGGGVALRDLALGFDKIVGETLETPYKTILSNSGLEDKGDWTAGKGFDVNKKEQVEMIKAGIIDPVMVTKLAIRHAFSVAAMILTTDTVVVDEEKNENNKLE